MWKWVVVCLAARLVAAGRPWRLRSEERLNFLAHRLPQSRQVATYLQQRQRAVPRRRAAEGGRQSLGRRKRVGPVEIGPRAAELPALLGALDQLGRRRLRPRERRRSGKEQRCEQE